VDLAAEQRLAVCQRDARAARAVIEDHAPLAQAAAEQVRNATDG